MFDGVTLGIAMGAVLGEVAKWVTPKDLVVGVTGNLATDALKRLHGAAAARFLDRHFALPENHDAVRAIRRSQLEALRSLLDEYAAAGLPRHDEEQARRIGAFTKGALAFVREQLGREDAPARLGDPEVLDALAKAIDSALADLPAGAAAQRATRLRAAAERAVLDELLDGARAHARDDPVEEVPPTFEGAFLGRNVATGGWFDRYILLLRDKLKRDDAFRSMYAAAHHALVAELLVDLAADQERLTRELLAAIGARSAAIELALASMAGDVGQVREVVRELRDLLKGDAALPLDLPSEDFAAEGFLRFSFKNLVIPFRGRETELARLETFLLDERRFAWWIATGGGGAGKSRLALELCLRQRGTWRAGFLPRSRSGEGLDATALRAWQPDRPTLVVIDYVLARPTEARELILDLARRGDGLAHPARVLLLERVIDARFEQAFYPSSSDRGEMLAARYDDNGPLAVPPLSDDELWDLARDFPRLSLGEAAALLTARAEFFARLDRLDRNHRALSALILAEALAAREDGNGFAELEDELRDLLRRDRENLWPSEIRDEVEAPFLALATMVDGLRKSQLAALPEEAQRLRHRKVHWRECAHLVGCAFDGPDPTLSRMEPDLIGEFFVLETLAPSDEMADAPHPWLPEAAWRLEDGERMAEFVGRLRENFPEHPSLAAMELIVPGVAASWRLRAVRARAECSGDMSAKLAAMRDAMHAGLSSDHAARAAFAELVLFATTFEAGAIESQDFRLLFEQLAGLFLDYPAEPVLREKWAKTVTNVINRTAAADPPGACQLLERLATLARNHSAEPALREEWAKSVINLVASTAAAEPSGARRFLDDLGTIARDHSNEPALREHWATSTFNFVSHAAGGDPPGARQLLEKLATLARDHSAEPALREVWAASVTNVVAKTAATDPAGAHRLIFDLGVLMADHRDEPALLDQWLRAKAALVWGHLDAGRIYDAMDAYITLAGLAHNVEKTPGHVAADQSIKEAVKELGEILDPEGHVQPEFPLLSRQRLLPESPFVSRLKSLIGDAELD